MQVDITHLAMLPLGFASRCACPILPRIACEMPGGNIEEPFMGVLRAHVMNVIHR